MRKITKEEVQHLADMLMRLDKNQLKALNSIVDAMCSNKLESKGA